MAPSSATRPRPSSRRPDPAPVRPLEWPRLSARWRPEPGETFDATARRELREETGLDVMSERLLWLREYIGAHHDGDPADHRVEATFLCRLDSDPHQLGNHAQDEVQIGLQWVELEKVPGLDLLPQGLRDLIAATYAKGDVTLTTFDRVGAARHLTWRTYLTGRPNLHVRAAPELVGVVRRVRETSIG
ncbi:NUDIX domain-containing protein [Kitasatospora sp. NPDC088783]|uniref:NUDIX domain-containing protein n=1 Tax=Kitasatospora sp. NPDC088783 TaxID=3364077 RepID=UPI0037F15973